MQHSKRENPRLHPKFNWGERKIDGTLPFGTYTHDDQRSFRSDPQTVVKKVPFKRERRKGGERMPIVNNRSARDGRREWGRIRKRGENRPEFKLQGNPAREGGKEEKEIRLAPAGVGMG